MVSTQQLLLHYLHPNLLLKPILILQLSRGYHYYPLTEAIHQNIVKNFEKAIYFEPKKSVYTKHFFANEFELDVNIYLENMPDVKSCIKNDGYIKIPYINNQGIYSQYIPDFFVKLKDDKVCIVETKGREDLDDIIKKTALEKKIEDINKTNDKSIYTSLYVKYDKFKNLSNKPSTFENFYELFKDL